MDATEVPDEWEQVKTEWDKTNQLGYEAVAQAAKVGLLLKALKDKDEANRKANGGRQNFSSMCEKFLPSMNPNTRATLIKLAKNLPLLEEQKPESQRAALKLIREANPKLKKEPASAPAPVVLRLKQSDFDLIRGCLPDDLKERFDQAKT